MLSLIQEEPGTDTDFCVNGISDVLTLRLRYLIQHSLRDDKDSFPLSSKIVMLSGSLFNAVRLIHISDRTTLGFDSLLLGRNAFFKLPVFKLHRYTGYQTKIAEYEP